VAGVLVFAEQRDGTIKKPALEAISEGRRIADALGGNLTALLIGDAPAAADALGGLGVDNMATVTDPRLSLYAPEAFTRAAQAAIAAVSPDVVLMSATAQGKDLAPRLAARLQTGLASDCTALTVASGAVTATRPVYSGKAFATVTFAGDGPAMATLRPNVFPILSESRDAVAAPMAVEVSFEDKDFRCRTTSIESTQGTTVDVAEADIVVSGGRAMKGPENFKYIKDLADALGGAVGASRAAVDAGWIDHQHQVGQTGKVVSPVLYIAAGISGAIQHIAGMSSSKVIVAINKDADAPIFKIADYGIVGDLYEVIPKMVEEIRKVKA